MPRMASVAMNIVENHRPFFAQVSYAQNRCAWFWRINGPAPVGTKTPRKWACVENVKTQADKTRKRPMQGTCIQVAETV